MDRGPVMSSLSNTSLDLMSQLGADDADLSGCVPSGFLARGTTVSPPPSKIPRTAGDLERAAPQPMTHSRPDAGASSTPLPSAQQSGRHEIVSADDRAQSAPDAAADDSRPSRAAAVIDHEALQLYERRPDLNVGAFAETLRAAG